MYSSPELVAAIQRERERGLQEQRLARLLARAAACCSDRLVDRLARALHLAPSVC